MAARVGLVQNAECQVPMQSSNINTDLLQQTSVSCEKRQHFSICIEFVGSPGANLNFVFGTDFTKIM